VTGLRPRPEVPPDVLRAVHDAVERIVADEQLRAPRTARWRFSGRWFSAHPIRTRSRPS